MRTVPWSIGTSFIIAVDTPQYSPPASCCRTELGSTARPQSTTQLSRCTVIARSLTSTSATTAI